VEMVVSSWHCYGGDGLLILDKQEKGAVLYLKLAIDWMTWLCFKSD